MRISAAPVIFQRLQLIQPRKFAKETIMNTSIKFRSFESKIAYMNGMYKLPLAAFPSFGPSISWQLEHGTHVIQTIVSNGKKPTDVQLCADRVSQFMQVVQKELNEGGDILNKLYETGKETDFSYQEIDYLVDMADWCGDIIVYCASEMARLGIPIMEVLSIIMDSNFSKLDANGQPIIKDGKFEKGPFYWKPEPKIRELLLELIRDNFQTSIDTKQASTGEG